MKAMKENSPLKDVCPDKKLTNHSARETVVKKLKSSGIPKCEIKNITGHSSVQGLDDYDSGDENEQRIMSNIIDNATNARQVLQPISSVQTAPSQVYNFSHCKVTLMTTWLEAILHNQVSVRASERVTRESLRQILTMISEFCSGFDPYFC